VERAVRNELSRLGVILIDGEIAAEVRPTEVITHKNRSIAYEICVWSGELRSAPIASGVGLATDRQGRIWVDPNLRSISHPHILAVGDAAHPIAPTGAPYRLSALPRWCREPMQRTRSWRRGLSGRLRPFSFSTLGQGIAIGRGGVGFVTYPERDAAALGPVD